MTIAPSAFGSYLPSWVESVNRKKALENTYKEPSTFDTALDASGAPTSWGFVTFGGTNLCTLDWKSLLRLGVL